MSALKSGLEAKMSLLHRISGWETEQINLHANSTVATVSLCSGTHCCVESFNFNLWLEMTSDFAATLHHHSHWDYLSLQVEPYLIKVKTCTLSSAAFSNVTASGTYIVIKQSENTNRKLGSDVKKLH